jgi:hypothetical protein
MPRRRACQCTFGRIGVESRSIDGVIWTALGSIAGVGFDMIAGLPSDKQPCRHRAAVDQAHQVMVHTKPKEPTTQQNCGAPPLIFFGGHAQDRCALTEGE